MEFCLITRELAPFVGGGIGLYAATLAKLLADDGTVTVVTSGAHEEQFRRLAAREHPLIDNRVRYRFVDEPVQPELGHYVEFHQAWGARVLAELEDLYGAHGPDLIEVPDYYCGSFVPLQAKRARHRTLRDTMIAVRAHSTWELCAVLNGHLPETDSARAVCDMERYGLRHADVFLWAGGDILGAYRRYYGTEAIAPARRVRHPFERGKPGHAARAGAGDYPLRFLYLGRLERRKGVLELIGGFMRNPSDAWTLTLVGADTRSAPLGASMRAEIELLVAGDERIRIAGPQTREQIAVTLAEHDVMVMPSSWECWPYSVLEALHANRPVLATPTGGLIELIEDGMTGWLTSGTAEADLTRGLEMLVASPERVVNAMASGACVDRCAELTDPGPIRASYRALIEEHHRRLRPAARRRSSPLVSAIVPYRLTPRHLLEAVDSLLAQSHRSLEVVIVNDGSFDASDAVLDEAVRRPRVRIVHQPNGGLGAARNAGIAHSHGRYLFPLDADNVAEPTFVARAVEMLEADPTLAYVTCWTRYIDEDGADMHADRPVGYQPLGNFSGLVERRNVAGDAAAVWPRWLWDRGFRYSEDVPLVEDWMLWRQMARAGRIGEVIPERLIRYRIRSDSMFRIVDEDRLSRLHAEMSTRLAMMEVQWTSPSV